MRRAAIAMTALLAALAPAGVAGSCAEDAMIVFDGSGSMSEMGFNLLDEPRIAEARRAMHRAIPQVAPHRRIGLMVYGPGDQGACRNIDVVFPPRDDAGLDILDTLDQLEPSGDTPLTASVFGAAEVLDYQNQPGVVVLVTDGNENCGGAPCELASLLRTEGLALTVHVIGFKVRGGHFSWTQSNGADFTGATIVASCLADLTGGLYVHTETVDQLVDALQQTLGCPLFGQSGPVNTGRATRFN